jgi:hypothetical protein
MEPAHAATQPAIKALQAYPQAPSTIRILALGSTAARSPYGHRAPCGPLPLWPFIPAEPRVKSIPQIRATSHLRSENTASISHSVPLHPGESRIVPHRSSESNISHCGLAPWQTNCRRPRRHDAVIAKAAHTSCVAQYLNLPSSCGWHARPGAAAMVRGRSSLANRSRDSDAVSSYIGRC